MQRIERRATKFLFVDNEVRDFLLHRLPLARTLRTAGIDVHVAVPHETGLDALMETGFSIHAIHLRRKSARPWDELRCFVSLLRLYRKLRPEVVHQIRLKPVLYGGIAARLAGVPAAVSMLTGLGHLFTARSWTARALRSAVLRGLRMALSHRNQRVIFQNPDDRECLVASGVLSAERAVLIKGSGVDLSVFRPVPEPEGTPVVLMASRLLWEKGVGEFVSAARALGTGGVRARFLLVGDPDVGHPSAVPVELLQEWQANGVVEWVRWQHDMPVVLARCHVVCLPSAYGEGVPRVLIEAAAVGRAIVTTDSPGCREIVRHGENGLLVPVRNRLALAEALRRLIEDPGMRAAMGVRGREIAGAEFAQERVIWETTAVYGELMKNMSNVKSQMSNVKNGLG